MKFKKILITGFEESQLDAFYLKRLDLLSNKRIYVPKDSPNIQKELADTDCLLSKFNPINKEWMDHAPHLKYIGVFATGYGQVDTDYAKKKGIIVCNIPGYSTESVAEFVIGMILEHIRELEKAKRQAKEGNYSEAGFSACEIKDKTFGVLGLGNIGSRVAELALGFGAKVQYWSRSRKKNYEQKGIKYENPETTISSSDFLSLHLVRTKDTDLFLNKQRIQKIKKGAVVINTCPMELIDIKALSERLAKGDITFIFDHPDEMSKEDLGQLSKYKNCIIYPPIGYISNEARMAKQKIFIDNIEQFLKGKPTHQVNA
ncbi:MAG: 2-hydroxyacid dehydrogenase [Nanoarchaeota archaeon]